MKCVSWLHIVHRANSVKVVAFAFTTQKEENFCRAGKPLLLLPSVFAKVKMSSLKLYEVPLPAFITECGSKSPIYLKWKEISFCFCKRRYRGRLVEAYFLYLQESKRKTEVANKLLSKVQMNLVTKVFCEYLLQIFRIFSLKLLMTCNTGMYFLCYSSTAFHWSFCNAMKVGVVGRVVYFEAQMILRS